MPTRPRALSGRPLLSQRRPGSAAVARLHDVGSVGNGIRARTRLRMEDRRRTSVLGLPGSEHMSTTPKACVVVINLFPRLAAVFGAKDAAIGRQSRRTERPPEDSDTNRIAGHNNRIGISRIDDDGLNVAHILQTDVRPGGAAVARFIETLARHLLAGANIDDIRGRRIDGHGSDGRNRHAVEDRPPDASTVGSLPDAATGRAEVVGIRIAGHARNRSHSAAAEWADQAPAHALVETTAGLLADQRERKQRDDENQEE